MLSDQRDEDLVVACMPWKSILIQFFGMRIKRPDPLLDTRKGAGIFEVFSHQVNEFTIPKPTFAGQI